VDIVFDEEELSDSDDSEDGSEDVSANQHIGCKNLSNTQRQEVYEALLQCSNNGKLKRNSTTEVANQFNVAIRTVQRAWRRAKGCRGRGEAVDVS